MDPNNSIDYNGVIGSVVDVIPLDVMRGGGGYMYEVEFKDVEMKYSELDPITRRLKRGAKIITIKDKFHEGYVDLVAPPPAPLPLAPSAPAVPVSSVHEDRIDSEIEVNSDISAVVTKKVEPLKLSPEEQARQAKIRADVLKEIKTKGRVSGPPQPEVKPELKTAKPLSQPELHPESQPESKPIGEIDIAALTATITASVIENLKKQGKLKDE